MQIKGISFDFWRTLYIEDENKDIKDNQMLHHLLELINRNDNYVKKEDLKHALESSIRECIRVYENEFRTLPAIDTIHFISKILRINLSKGTVVSAAKILQEIILDYPPKPLSGTLDIIKKLSIKFALAITSNTGFSGGNILRRILQKDSILKYFTAFSFSDEIGRTKPHRDIFLHTTKELSLEPWEVVHIGDNIYDDILGAQQSGLKTILFTGANNVKSYSTLPEAFTKAKDCKANEDWKACSWNEVESILSELK